MAQVVRLKELLSEIKQRADHCKHFVVALSGFGGAGKSTTANVLAESLGSAEIVHLDDFIHDRLSQRSDNWDDFEWDRLVDQVIKPIAQGADVIEYDVYDWKANRIVQKKKINLPKYVILEGVGLIRDDLRKYFDATIWIDVSLETATERGKRRDVEEYGLPQHAELWDTIWTPNDRDYFKKYRPEDVSDFLLKNQ